MSNRRPAGFTLIELIIAIVIIGVGLAGVMLAFSTVVRSSSDPLVGKQALAVAEELMEEIRLQTFPPTGTAPANALTPCGTAGAVRNAFNDVFDYNNYQTSGVCDINGAAITGLASYNVAVTVVNHADLGAAVSVANAARITVTVSSPSQTLTLVGWRTNYQ